MLDRVTLQSVPVRIGGSARIRFTTPAHMHAGFMVDPVPLTQLASLMGVPSLKAGVFQAMLDLEGQVADWKGWQLSGWIGVTHGLLQGEAPDTTIRDVNLRVQFLGQQAVIRYLMFETRDHTFRISGYIKDWAHTPQVDVHIDSPRLDLQRLFIQAPRTNASSRFGIGAVLRKVATSSRTMLNLQTDYAHYQKFLFTDVSSRLQLADGTRRSRRKRTKEN